MRIFITGATGFIGEYVTRQLLDRGHDIVALARRPSKASALAERGVTIHQGDITDKESMRGGMQGADALFHIAGWYEIGTRDKSKAYTINVEGTRNVLELMRDLEIPKGVYTSTLAVFSDTGGEVVDESYRYEGEHHSVYDRTKWKAHYEVAVPMMEDGLPLVIVQPGIVHGPGDHSAIHDTLVQYIKRTLPLVPAGFGGCWSRVEDCARGHVLALEKGQPGEAYIIGGPPRQLSEVLDIAEEITGIPTPLITASPGMLRATAALMSLVAPVVPLPTTIAPESLRVSAGSTYYGSSDKAREELGWSATPLREGLQKTLFYEMRRLGKEPPEGMEF